MIFPGAQPSRSRNGGAVIAELRFYDNETTTPKTVYANSALTVPLSFPVVSNDAGAFVAIWADTAEAYTVNWSTADGQTLTLDNVTASLAADAAILDQTEDALEAIEGLVAGYAGTVLYEFSTTTTDSDPGAGKLRFNNATVGSVTFLYIDNTDLNGVSATTFLDSFDDANSGSNRGTVIVRSLVDSAAFLVGYVSGAVIDGTGYRKVPVTWKSGTTRPADATNVSLTFAAAGPQGAAGSDGKDGSAATVTVGNTTTGAPGSNAEVKNVGTSSAAVFDFTIPRGNPGTGDVSSSGIITVGTVAVWSDDSPATIESGGKLGTMATQNANAVAITGGSITGITDLAVADGGTGVSTFTDGGVLIGNGTGAVQVTAVGTKGHVLTSNGSGDPTFQAIPSQTWTQLDTKATTSGTTISFTSISQSYSDLLFVFEGVSSNTAGAEAVQAAVSNNNGTNYSTAVSISGGAGPSETVGGAILVPGYLFNAGLMTSGLSTSWTSTRFLGGATSAATAVLAWAASGSIDAVRFSWESGAAFDAGTITLYGR